MPPPAPVIAPSRIAGTAPTRKSSAFVAPVTQNRPSPTASKIRTLRWMRSRAGRAKKRAILRRRRLPDSASRGSRRRHADQQVADDAPGQPDDRGENDDSE